MDEAARHLATVRAESAVLRAELPQVRLRARAMREQDRLLRARLRALGIPQESATGSSSIHHGTM